MLLLNIYNNALIWDNLYSQISPITMKTTVVSHTFKIKAINKIYT
jgi:hypothetical protein